MEQLSSRAEQLLSGVVEEYVRTARPVGSSHLAEYLKLEVSPATVRAILHELEESGLIYQPHTSAGRIPTDQGYRYYVDHLREARIGQREQALIEQRFLELRQQYNHLAHSTAKLLALLAHSVVVSGIPQTRTHQLAGLRELLKQPEGASREAMQEVSEVVEALDEYLTQFDPTSRQPHVFIGEEIPFVNAQHTSVLVRGVHPENSERLTLVIIGPKRMAYQRNVALLNAVSDIIEDSYDEAG